MIVMSIQHVNREWDINLVKEAMDYAFENYPADKNKAYLIGTSGGGHGAWSFAEAYADRVAAIVPISGWGDEDKACNVKGMGVWAFHNEKDDIVHPGKTLSMIDAVKSCSGSEGPKLQLFPDRGHNCWRRVFDPNHEDWKKSPNIPRVNIFEWLLTHEKTANN
jgi:predicted peptidase